MPDVTGQQYGKSLCRLKNTKALFHLRNRAFLIHSSQRLRACLVSGGSRIFEQAFVLMMDVRRSNTCCIARRTAEIRTEGCRKDGCWKILNRLLRRKPLPVTAHYATGRKKISPSAAFSCASAQTTVLSLVSMQMVPVPFMYSMRSWFRVPSAV